MLSRTISTACLLLCLGALTGACDEKKAETKDDPKAKAAKADEKQPDVKADEKKADEAKADEKKADEAKADEAKADEAKADEAKADEAKADEKKADEAKVEEKKAEEKKVEEKKTDTTKKPADPPKPDPGPSADGKGLYDKKCKSCHNSNGDGKTKIGGENDIEDWTVAGWKGKWTEQKIVDIVTNGKSGTKMKPFKDKMTADEITAVSKYARSLGK